MSPAPRELASAALAAAGAFRLGLETEANQRLLALVDGLGAAPPRALDARALAAVLGRAADAQARADWIAIADALEHELAPMLA